jgi:hypothetical protein
MGLDMYLNKMNYVKNWQHHPKETHHHVLVTQDGKPCTHILPKRITYIVEEVAYWRKANAIHRWFVENVQDDKDDCGTYSVTRDQLSQLRDDCRAVLAASTLIDGKITNGHRYENGNMVPILEDGKTIKDASVAMELLPTQSGFFFGSTDYDKYYYDDLVYTREVLDKLLAEPGDEFQYHSSW